MSDGREGIVLNAETCSQREADSLLKDKWISYAPASYQEGFRAAQAAMKSMRLSSTFSFYLQLISELKELV